MRFKSLFAILLGFGLTSCGHTFHDYGTPPEMTQPQTQNLMEDILIVPEPEAVPATSRIEMSDNSIWNKKEAIYFKDTRAFEVGDILTVVISINESARINSSADRQSTIDGSLNGTLEGTVSDFVVPNVGVSGSGGSDISTGRSGTINRSEKIDLQIAAAVVAASANGNLKVYGTQEVRVNSELRLMEVQGIVRSKDIAPDNSIPYEKIAEARISYGGHNTSKFKRKRFLPKLNLPKLSLAKK